jgi:hypothetical protein
MSGPEKNSDISHGDGFVVGLAQERLIGDLMRFFPVAEIVFEVGEHKKLAGFTFELRGRASDEFPQVRNPVLPEERVEQLEMKLKVRRVGLEMGSQAVFSLADISASNSK